MNSVQFLQRTVYGFYSEQFTIFVCMLAIVQIARPNWITFLREPMGTLGPGGNIKAKNVDFFSSLKIKICFSLHDVYFVFR